MVSVPISYLVIVIVSFCFGVALLLLALIKNKKELHYLYPVFLLNVHLIAIPLAYLNFDISWSVWITGPFKITIIPLLFLYIKKHFEHDKRLKRKELLHFLPTLLNTLFTIPIAYFHASDVVNHGNFDTQEAMQTIWDGNFYYILTSVTGRSIIFLQSVFYFFRLFPIIKKCIQYQKNQTSYQNANYILWTKLLSYVFIIWAMFDGAAIFGAYSISWLLITITAIRFIIMIFTFLYAVLYINEKSLILPNQEDLIEFDQKQLENKSDEQMDWITEFKKRELYLQPDLNLQTLSEILKIPKYKITQLSQRAGYNNFYTFVNTHRIEKSKLLLMNKPKNYVIESIIENSGFKSRSTFFRVFKEITGETPGHFINNISGRN